MCEETVPPGLFTVEEHRTERIPVGDKCWVCGVCLNKLLIQKVLFPSLYFVSMTSVQVEVGVLCLDGVRDLVFKSAKSCSCYHCKKD